MFFSGGRVLSLISTYWGFDPGMRSRILTFIIVMVFWFLITFSIDLQHAIVGLLLAFIVAMSGVGDMFAGKAGKWLSARRYWFFVLYVLIFLKEVAKANIDVAYRVLHPELPIRPGIVKVKTDIKSETGLTFLANSITLTPGTLSVDVDAENGIIYVHWIYVKDRNIEEASRLIAGRFEKVIKEVFG